MSRLVKTGACALALALSFGLLTGCGSSAGGSETAALSKEGQEQTAGSENAANEGAASKSAIVPAEVKVTDYATGVTELRDLTKQFKQAVESGDTAEPKRIAEQAAGVWNAVKQDLQSKHSDLFPQLDRELSGLLDLFHAEALDSEAAVQQAYQLYQLLRDLAQYLEDQ